MNRLRSAFVGILAGLSFFSAPAFAVPVTWHFQDVVLDDGSTITGSYVFDADLGSFQNFSNINVTSDFGTYSVVNPVSSGGADFLNFVGDPAVNGAPSLSAQLAEVMTNAGGTIAILPAFFLDGTGFSFLGTCSGDPDCSLAVVSAGIASGFVTTTPAAVPLPAAMWMFLAGLGGLVSIRRRRVS